jgi:hypothetical protein
MANRRDRGSLAGYPSHTGYRRPSTRNSSFVGRVFVPDQQQGGRTMGRALILWLLGVPISVIILIALFTNFI